MVKASEKGAVPQPAAALMLPKINISEIKQIIMMCPATILAKRRMIRANGLMKTLMNSTGTRINLTPNGTPGGLKICAQ